MGNIGFGVRIGGVGLDETDATKNDLLSPLKIVYVFTVNIGSNRGRIR